jgi:hypothetical protein
VKSSRSPQADLQISTSLPHLCLRDPMERPTGTAPKDESLERTLSALLDANRTALDTLKFLQTRLTAQSLKPLRPPLLMNGHLSKKRAGMTFAKGFSHKPAAPFSARRAGFVDQHWQRSKN